ncbi:hypothetical protein RYX36_019906 [Vicia faba]
MVEKSGECGFISAYGKGQRVIPHCQGYDFVIPIVPNDVSGNSHDRTKKLASKVVVYLDQYIEAIESYLIAMYAKSGLIRTSELLFEKSFSSDREQATWKVMIAGYTQNRLNEKAILLLKEILVQKFNGKYGIH